VSERIRTCLVTRLTPLCAALSLALAACTPAQPPAPTVVPAPPKAGATQPAAAAPTAKAAPEAPQAEAKPATVALKSAYTSTSATLAPITAAKEGGFFDEEGLEVSLARLQAGAPAMAALRGGDVPIALIGAQQIIEANLKGGDFVVLASFGDKLSQSLYVHPSIERSDQLRGKAIGVNNFGSIPHVAGKVALDMLGLKDQATFVATGGPPETLAALQAGTVQGIVISPPDSFKARDLGYRELVDLAKTNVASVNAAIVSTRKWARENPDVAERYIRAMLKATARMINEREFGVKTIGKHSGLEDPKILEETYAYYRETYNRDGFPSMKGLQHNLEVASEEIPEAKSAKPEQFVDLTFLEKIKASGLLERLYGR
jgi:NitT/TauT family transport system substrate-binding protein